MGRSKSSKKTMARDTVTLARSEYERLLAKAGETIAGGGPPLPKPDARGNFPAIEYIRASIARELIRRRRSSGLSQSALAEQARVRQETISNIERCKQTVSEPVMTRIEKVLLQAERRRRGGDAVARRRSA